MTLIHEHDLTILKMYLTPKMNFTGLVKAFKSLTITDRHTDRCDRTHYNQSSRVREYVFYVSFQI